VVEEEQRKKSQLKARQDERKKRAVDETTSFDAKLQRAIVSLPTSKSREIEPTQTSQTRTWQPIDLSYPYIPPPPKPKVPKKKKKKNSSPKKSPKKKPIEQKKNVKRKRPIDSSLKKISSKSKGQGKKGKILEGSDVCPVIIQTKIEAPSAEILSFFSQH